MFKNLIIILITLVLAISCTEKATNKSERTVLESLTIEDRTEDKKEAEINFADVTFATLDGQTVAIGDYKGQRILVNLWATWCGPCIREMPSLNRAYNILKDENYAFLVASNEDINKIKGFAEATGFDFPIVKADDMFQPFDIRVIPTTMIFDTEGNLVTTMTGGLEWDADNVLQELRAVK